MSRLSGSLPGRRRGRRRRHTRGTLAVPLGLIVALMGLGALVTGVPLNGEGRWTTQATLPSPAGEKERSQADPAEEPAAEIPPLLRSVVDEVDSAEGDLVVVEGESEVTGEGPLRRYVVEVEEGLPGDPEDFAAAVEEVLGDPRSWGGDGDMSFQRVDSGSHDFRVALAAPDTTDSLCAPLNTNGYLSCHNGGRAVINQNRWVSAVEGFEDVETYRTYVINHEIGHALGHGHVPCPGRGEVAPVMQQQSISLDGCEPNGWVHP